MTSSTWLCGGVRILSEVEKFLILDHALFPMSALGPISGRSEVGINLDRASAVELYLPLMWEHKIKDPSSTSMSLSSLASSAS